MQGRAGTKHEMEATRLSNAITAAMEDRGVSIRDLAKKIEVTYEHMRRIVRGAGEPSKYVLKLICDELKLPYKELLDVAKATEMQEKYGDLPVVLAGKKPGMEPIDRVWDQLTEDQQEGMVVLAQAWAQANRARE